MGGTCCLELRGQEREDTNANLYRKEGSDMSILNKEIAEGAATPIGETDGINSRFCSLSNPTTAKEDYTTCEFTWMYFSPLAIKGADEMREATIGALERIKREFEACGSLVYVHNQLMQLASEIERLSEMA